MALPALGHIKQDKGIVAPEPIGRAAYIKRGRHLLIGQREGRGETESLAYLGKCIEHTKVQDKYVANVWFDVSFPHVVFVSGTRGSGKSFDIGVIVEGLLLPASSSVCTERGTASVVIFDLQNQFWTLSKTPDPKLGEDKGQLKALADWGLRPSSLSDVRLLIPPGQPKYIGTEEDLVISFRDLTADDLCMFWGTDAYCPQGHLINTLIDKVSASGYDSCKVKSSGETSTRRVSPRNDYEVSDLVACLQTDADIGSNVHQQVVDAVLWRLHSLERTGLFRASGVSSEDLLRKGTATVLLLRGLDDATKSLVTGALMKRVYNVMGEYHSRRRVLRRLRKKPSDSASLPDRVWCVIDEAHVVCPGSRETSATRSVVEYVKRGRDAGLSLVLATQQPSAINTRVLSQVDLALVHRLTFEGDISAALARIPAHLPSNFKVGSSSKDPRMLVRLLECGEVIVGDSQTDRAFVALIRPRLTAHGGAEPK